MHAVTTTTLYLDQGEGWEWYDTDGKYKFNKYRAAQVVWRKGDGFAVIEGVRVYQNGRTGRRVTRAINTALKDLPDKVREALGAA